MITRQKVYDKVAELVKNGHDLHAESHGDPRLMYIYTADQSRLLAGGMTPAQADLWLSGYIDGYYARKVAQS
jgi:hypothetical protein